MASDLIVLMGATEIRGTMPTYINQLQDAGIEYRVIDCSDKPNKDGGGNLGYRVRKFKELANQFSEYERLVITDSFDMTFWGSKQDVISKIPMDRLVHAAEKNCYPPDALSLAIPDNGKWKYANGGAVAGTPENFIHWCTYTERLPRYNPECLDQYELNYQLADGIGCGLDSQTELFLCLYGGYEEIEFENGIPINTMYGTHPQFIHANGKWDTTEMFEKHKRSLR